MGFFDKLFDTKEKEMGGKLNWNKLEKPGQLDEIIKISAQTPVLIFKHSTRCAISRFALKQFENEYEIPEEKAEPFFLDLLQHRDVSNEIAQRFSVQHQSPQLIVIKNGKAIYNISHGDISAEEAGRVIEN